MRNLLLSFVNSTLYIVWRHVGRVSGEGRELSSVRAVVC